MAGLEFPDLSPKREAFREESFLRGVSYLRRLLLLLHRPCKPLPLQLLHGRPQKTSEFLSLEGIARLQTSSSRTRVNVTLPPNNNPESTPKPLLQQRRAQSKNRPNKKQLLTMPTYPKEDA